MNDETRPKTPTQWAIARTADLFDESVEPLFPQPLVGKEFIAIDPQPLIVATREEMETLAADRIIPPLFIPRDTPDVPFEPHDGA